MKVNSQLLANSVAKSLRDWTSTIPQDLNVEDFVSFPILIKHNFNSIIEEPCAENPVDLTFYIC